MSKSAPAPMYERKVNPSRCPSEYVTDSGPWGTDLVQCQKPVGHKKQEHSFPFQDSTEVARWTDAEARA